MCCIDRLKSQSEAVVRSTEADRRIRVDLTVSAFFLINAFDNRAAVLTRSAKVEKKL